MARLRTNGEKAKMICIPEFACSVSGMAGVDAGASRYLDQKHPILSREPRQCFSQLCQHSHGLDLPNLQVSFLPKYISLNTET